MRAYWRRKEKSMLTFNDKQYRNLEEQVLKNKEDITDLITKANISDLGIKIVTAEPFASESDLPLPYAGDYGDAFLVGEVPYELYVWTRADNEYNGQWFDWGELNAPSVVPGPIGPQGIQGEAGTRGSLWYSQSGRPTNIVGVNNNDQAVDGTTGDLYQFVNGVWQLTGNIRGPQGIQGIQGIQGLTGPVGPQGIQGPKGDAADVVDIRGTLDNVDQLPMVDTVPRNTAYLIPDDTGAEHIWLIIGEGTTENPYLWHDAGSLSGGGATVKVDGVSQSQVEIGYLPKISVNYQIGEGTTVSSNGSEITFSNLQAVGYDVNNNQIEGLSTIELPIATSNDIQIVTADNAIELEISQNAWDKIEELVGDAKPEEVQITAPTTSTNGQLTAEQMSTLQNNKGAYLMFNNEIYRLQDTQHTAGYLVYTHIGYENTTQVYNIKCITITINTRGWVLTTRKVVNPENAELTKITFPKTNTYITSTNPAAVESNSITMVASEVRIMNENNDDSNYGGKLAFGDGDYVNISEPEDDVLQFAASDIRFVDDEDKQTSVTIDGTLNMEGRINLNGGDNKSINYPDGQLYINNSQGQSAFGQFGGEVVVGHSTMPVHVRNNMTCDAGITINNSNRFVNGYSPTHYQSFRMQTQDSDPYYLLVEYEGSENKAYFVSRYKSDDTSNKGLIYLPAFNGTKTLSAAQFSLSGTTLTITDPS